MGGTKALLFLDYMEAQDSSAAFTSPHYSLVYPVSAIGYQLSWGASAVGEFIFEATIFEDKWEALVSCSEITVPVLGGTAATSIVAIPHAWLMASKLRFRWVPDVGGSSGNIDVALRIVPT